MRRNWVLCVVFLTAVAATGFARTPEFQGLGFLPGGGSYSRAYGVSGDGSVVVGEAKSGPAASARCWPFLWTQATGMVGLADAYGNPHNGLAKNASADGSVIVGFFDSDQGYEAFRWTAETGMVGLGDLPGLDFDSRAWGVSADGSVVVGYGDPGSMVAEAFRWTQTTGMVGLGELPGGEAFSMADSVSADGAVVVGNSKSAAGREAYLWTSATGMVTLGDLPGGNFASGCRGLQRTGRSSWDGASPRPARKPSAGHRRRAWSGWVTCPEGTSPVAPKTYLPTVRWSWEPGIRLRFRSRLSGRRGGACDPSETCWSTIAAWTLRAGGYRTRWRFPTTGASSLDGGETRATRLRPIAPLSLKPRHCRCWPWLHYGSFAAGEGSM